MLVSPDDFARHFPGEGGHVEFKEGVSDRKIREAAVAFANEDGGVVLVGVRNDGSIVGVSDPGEAERRLRDALSGIHYPGRTEVRQVEVGESTVLVLSVDRRREGFSQLPDGAVKVRRGARNETLIGPDLTRFQRSRSFERFENTVTAATLHDAAHDRVTLVADAYGFDPSDAQRSLEERGLVERRHGTPHLTAAGALILLDAPRLLGRCGVEVLRYSGAEPDPDKRQLITGPVDLVVTRATDSILEELGEQSVVVGVTRVELPRLPVRAIREAVANAVAHRSYEANGTHARVEIRPGSVVITSPGPLPEPVTVEHMRSQQAARNPLVLEFLRRMNLAEDLGLGVDRIEDDMQFELLEPPQFEETAHHVSVTLLTRSSVSPEERAWVRQLISDRAIEARDAVVVLQAVRERFVTNSSVREALGLDSTEVRTILQRLRDQGILLQEGQRGGAQYVPAPLLGMPRVSAASIDQLADALLAHFDDGAGSAPQAMSNADVRKLLAVDRPTALRVLTTLLDRGELLREGERRGTRYRRAELRNPRLDDV